MAQVSLPYTLTAGQPENVNQLVANLDALVAGVNTVNTAQIADANVTTAKIADGAVTSAKILDGTITTADLAASVGNFGAWATYTPALTASTTNPTLGTSPTQTGYYVQIGKFVQVAATIEFGTGGSVSAGSGTYYVSVPVARNTTSIGTDLLLGQARLVDSSTSQVAYVSLRAVTSTTVSLSYVVSPPVAATFVTNAVPWTWAAGDSLSLYLSYEAA